MDLLNPHQDWPQHHHEHPLDLSLGKAAKHPMSTPAAMPQQPKCIAS